MSSTIHVSRTSAALLYRAGLPVLIAACVSASCQPRVITQAKPIEFRIIEESAPALKESAAQLANMLVCTDSLGRPMSPDEGSLCVPCVPMTAVSDAIEAQRHARRVWQQVAKSPYDDADVGASCVRLSYEFAMQSDSNNTDLRIEHAQFQLASAVDSVRAQGLTTLDNVLDSMLQRGDSASASALLASTASSVWERGQRMFARSEIIDVNEREKRVHDLQRGAPPLRRLPPIPASSNRLGVSEGQWASHLFANAALLAQSTAAKARLDRLSMAPSVVLGQWRTLDSIAQVILARQPRDSVASIAHALATYELGRWSIAEYKRIDAAFDSALSNMPSSDSARYDNFDEVFTARDDEWRYGFLPGIRDQLDRRAWKVVDPLWFTSVNEMRLARRARKVEADFRYADIARSGQSGSETDAGVLLVKAGRPSERWTTRFSGPYYTMDYGWSEYQQRTRVWRDDETWRIFYGDMMSPSTVARTSVNGAPTCADNENVLVNCARAKNASWNEVVFYGRLDTIDVALARFRAGADSVDLYLGSRLPLRGFRHRGSDGARIADSIDYGFWVSTSMGDVLHHRASRRQLPRESEIAWTQQWTSRLGDGSVMHRVEAVDLRHARGARGAAMLTSAEAAIFQLHGFGISDILVAERVTPKRALLETWRDLEIVPNGGVVAPGVPVALAWEIYGLKTGPDGRAQWRVQLRREDGMIRSLFDAQSLIIGSPNAGTQLIPIEPNASDIRYVRTEPARAKVVEYLRFNLADAAPGRHVVVLEVEDMVAKTRTTRSVSLRILQPSAQSRSRPGVAPPQLSGFQLLQPVPSQLNRR